MPESLHNVLLTRLLPPRQPPGLIAREELAERMARALEGRLVAVIAGAGYGKTTALARALERGPYPFVWCSCDDRLDPSLLLDHLLTGLAGPIPGFGAGVRLSGPPGAQLGALANEIAATVADDVVLVLDDTHALPVASQDILSQLVRDLPPQVHFAFASRTPLPFPLGRLRTSGVHEFGERDLALRSGEAADLLATATPGLSELQVREIVERSEGWAAGLILAAQAAEAGAAPSRGIGEDEVFDYMAEEVFEAQSPDLQRFLLDTALFDRFTPELAGEGTGRPDAAEVCRSLVRHHLFTVRLDSEGRWFRYHHLLRAFLLRRCGEEGDESLRGRHRRAAAAWMAVGGPAEAIGHLIVARDFTSAAEVLEPIVEQMINSPQAGAVAEWLDAMPEGTTDGHPGLILAEGSLPLNQGLFDEALEALERALQRLLVLGQHDRAAVAVFRMLLTHHASGVGHDRGIAVGETYLPQIDPAARMLPVVRVLLAGSYGWAGRFGEAESELAAAEQSPAASAFAALPAYVTIVRAYYIERLQGRMTSALKGLAAGISMLERDPAADTLGLLAYTHAYRGFACTVVGLHEEALLEADRIVSAADERGMAPGMRRAVAWIRILALAPLERWTELEEALEVLARDGPQIERTPAGHVLHAMSARLAAHLGDRATVVAEVAAARSSMAGLSPELDQVGVLCELALASRDVGLDQEAADLGRRALATGEALGMPWHLARAATVAADCLGDCPDGDAALALGLAVTQENEYFDLWSVRERALAAPLLARAIRHNLGPPGVAARLAAACGAEVLREVVEALPDAPGAARAALAVAAADAPDVEVETVDRLLRDQDPAVRDAAKAAWSRRTEQARPSLRLVGLGGFAVFRDGVRVPRSAFGRERARALLAALLCAGRPVHREELLEWFWPDLPPDRAARSFHVALHGLRRGLEPQLDRGAADSIISQEAESYRIHLREGDRWDVAEFLALTEDRPADGATAVQRLRAAESAYVGPLYPEWPYADWARQRRDEVEGAHRSALDRLARALLAEGKPEETAAPVPPARRPGARARSVASRSHGGVRGGRRARARPASVPRLPHGAAAGARGRAERRHPGSLCADSGRSARGSDTGRRADLGHRRRHPSPSATSAWGFSSGGHRQISGMTSGQIEGGGSVHRLGPHPGEEAVAGGAEGLPVAPGRGSSRPAHGRTTGGRHRQVAGDQVLLDPLGPARSGRSPSGRPRRRGPPRTRPGRG